MDTVTIAAITGSVTAIIGAAGGVAGKFFLDNRRQNATEVRERDAQANSQLNGIIDRLENRIVTLEKNHTDCLNDKAEMIRAFGEYKAETAKSIGKMEGQIIEQREAMHKLRNESHKQNLQVIESAASVAATSAAAAVSSPARPPDSQVAPLSTGGPKP